MTGPMTVADYMKEVLVHPHTGYYINKDVFGQKGDFITSPEISQLFGELLGVWSVYEWQKIGAPKPLQIIELGPGRGSMMQDILKVYSRLKLNDSIKVHLVEISPKLSQIQSNRLCESLNEGSMDDLSYRKGITKFGVPISWHKMIEDVPRGFSCIFAHEFFDALPIHKFQKTENGWREVLIDIDPKHDKLLRYVLSPGPTPATKVFASNDDTANHREVCPQAGVIMEHLAIRLEEHGGFALIADYGHLGDKYDTFRAFKEHKLHDPLIEPGSADLTADVDFTFLKKSVADKLVTLGPVPQRQFLNSMHIDARLKILLENCKTEVECKNLSSGYKMLMDPDKMGERFKFMALFPAVLEPYLNQMRVAGFQD
ncbi:hypothetical protein AAG570_010934 [Ranatra chinensis]|uniref:Protein arginine methyltransferase NDUFAF7 n=1 Tax=Ranatra chinensis TaxID=642074 RepID=A0ABD0YJE6_9HEMI